MQYRAEMRIAELGGLRQVQVIQVEPEVATPSSGVDRSSLNRTRARAVPQVVDQAQRRL